MTHNAKKPLLIFILSLLLVWNYLPAQAFPVQNAPVIGFSPDGDALSVVLGGIQSAQYSIEVAAYSFTSKPIATALINAVKRNVKIRVVADEKASLNRYTAVTFLANQGVSVRLTKRYAIMHNKYMIIDSRHVQTGSFNYTSSAATKNAENVILLRNVPDVAEIYLNDFEKLYAQGVELRP